MKITLLVAHDRQNAIGKDGELPWHLRDDLKWFKSHTINKLVVMGRTTWNTLQVQPLPKRINCIMTRNQSFSAPGAMICHSIFDVFSLAQATEQQEIMIIGGGQIYELFYPIATDLIITEVDTTIEGADTYFVQYNKKNWHEVFDEPHAKDDQNDHNFTFKMYKKTISS